MKKSMKKKALVSSVAMLSVATLALGSATYAWFTSNPNASASGLQLKTTASTGLVIKTDTDDVWSHEAAIAKDKATMNLNPVSQKQSAPDTFYTVEADVAGAYGQAQLQLQQLKVSTKKTFTADFQMVLIQKLLQTRKFMLQV